MPGNNKNIRISQIFMELTNLCNFDCVFCPNDRMTRRRQFMDPALAKSLIDQIVDNKISEKIAFCLMGEPLLYNHIFEILKYAVDRNIKATLSTNAALLSRGNNINNLLGLPLDVLQVSLQTAGEDSFKLRRDRSGLSYKEYIEGVKTIIERKIKTRSAANLDILFMDTGFNLSKLFLNGNNTLKIKIERKETKRLAASLRAVAAGLEQKQCGTSGLIKDVSLGLKRFIFGNYNEQAAPGVRFTFGGVHNWGEALVDEKVLPASFGSCNALTGQFAILCNGDYSLCCKDYNGDLVIGNAHKQSLREILTSEKAQKIKKDFRRCRLKFQRCRICRGGTNIAELALKQIFTSCVYNTPFILSGLKKIVLK